jgi:DNA-binding MarR family transcriptional regulator
MQEKSMLDKQEFIFGAIFDMANKLQVLGDRHLGQDGMTTKQWFLTLIIEQFGDHPPTLGEVTQKMGSSHQNVKQLALKLEKKGFLSIEKDLHDSRVLRLRLTPESRAFWDNRIKQDEQFIENLFVGMTVKEVKDLYTGVNTLYQRILKLSTNQE